MQAPTIEVNAQDIAEGTDLHSLMGAGVPGFNLQQSDACRVVKTEAGPADVATVYDEVAHHPTSGKGKGGGEGEGMSNGNSGEGTDTTVQSGLGSDNSSGFNPAASMPGTKQRGSFRKPTAAAEPAPTEPPKPADKPTKPAAAKSAADAGYLDWLQGA